MAVLNCLYVDDSARDRSRFERFLRFAWQRVPTAVELTVATEATVDAARARLEHETFDLLLVDIVFGREAAGLELIREARAAHPATAIIAISIKSEYREDALAVGADDFVAKPYIAGRDLLGEYLEKVMRRVLKQRGRDHLLSDVVAVQYDERDLALTADIEDIGKPLFAALTVPLVGRPCSKLTVGRVRPGFSGSIVFRVVCDLRVTANAPAETRDLLVKVSRERELLLREVQRWESADAFPAELFVRNLATAGVVEAGGWHAIGYEFQQRARTFADWLVRERPTTASVDAVLSWLFLESGMAAVYSRHTTDTGTRPNDAILSVLTSSRRARSLDAIDEFATVAQARCGSHFDAALLKNAVRHGRIGGIDSGAVKAGTALARCHGDLHTRNVLVGVHNRPRLIDPANIGVMPLYADVARFTTDIFMSTWDAGPMSLDLYNIADWCDALFVFYTDEDMNHAPGGAANGPAAAALNWMRAQLDNICPTPGSRWQWYLSMAVEMLRASYRPDLSPQKRIAALAGACDALRNTETTYHASSA